MCESCGIVRQHGTWLHLARRGRLSDARAKQQIMEAAAKARRAREPKATSWRRHEQRLPDSVFVKPITGE